VRIAKLFDSLLLLSKSPWRSLKWIPVCCRIRKKEGVTMTTLITNAKLITPNGIRENRNILLSGKVIAGFPVDVVPADTVIDAEGAYVCPGFIDIHVHGGDGYEFIDATKEAVLAAANIHGKHGTTTIYPTLSAYSESDTCAAMDVIRDAAGEASLIPNIGGVHLEGPYFSVKQAGAQDPQYIRDPDPEEYQRIIAAYGDLIRRWSYAPERSGAEDFQRCLAKHGIVGAAGHTDAEYDHMKAVFDLGCCLVTHLYSGTSTITRKGGFRHLGVIETAYLLDEMDVETIADGCHLPPLLLKLIYKLKGRERMCLITDAIRFGGRTDCGNVLSGTASVPYIIEDGVAKLADRSAFAGSIATMDALVRVCVQKTGIPLEDAVYMATAVPARIMGLDRKGQLQEGYDADLVMLDEQLQVKNVFIGGEQKV